MLACVFLKLLALSIYERSPSLDLKNTFKFFQNLPKYFKIFEKYLQVRMTRRKVLFRLFLNYFWLIGCDYQFYKKLRYLILQKRTNFEAHILYLHFFLLTQCLHTKTKISVTMHAVVP